MSTYTRQQRFTKSSSARYRVLDGEAVVVEQNAGEMMTLNATGTQVLELAVAGASVGEIVDQISSECADPNADIPADVDSFLRELERNSVLDRSPEEDD